VIADHEGGNFVKVVQRVPVKIVFDDPLKRRSGLDAFRDVVTAPVSYANAKVRRDKLADEFASDSKAVDIAQLLYELGVETFLPRTGCGTLSLCGGR
jgi:hypothetical protein